MRNRAVRAAALGLALALVAGCDEQGAEGDRCNPYLSHNDCNGGLVCAGHAPSAVTIPFCQENFCCPVDDNGNITGSNPNCQPGCNGSAAALCTDTMDPGACLLSEGGSLQAALDLDDAGSSLASPPGDSGGASDSAASGDSTESSTSADSAEASPTGSE